MVVGVSSREAWRAQILLLAKRHRMTATTSRSEAGDQVVNWIELLFERLLPSQHRYVYIGNYFLRFLADCAVFYIEVRPQQLHNGVGGAVHVRLVRRRNGHYHDKILMELSEPHGRLHGCAFLIADGDLPAHVWWAECRCGPKHSALLHIPATSATSERNSAAFRFIHSWLRTGWRKTEFKSWFVFLAASSWWRTVNTWTIILNSLLPALRRQWFVCLICYLLYLIMMLIKITY